MGSLYFWNDGDSSYHSISHCPLRREAPSDERKKSEDRPDDMEACVCVSGSISRIAVKQSNVVTAGMRNITRPASRTRRSA